MSITGLSRTLNYSLSPSIDNLKNSSKLVKGSSPLNDVELTKPGIAISKSINQFPGHLSKLIKISAKKFESKPNILGFHIRDTSKNHTFLSGETKQASIEDIIRKKLQREEKLEKKLEVFLNFSEKLSGNSKTFKVFFHIFSEIFQVVQEELRLCEKLKETERNLKQLCDSLTCEVDDLKANSESLLGQLGRVKSESKSLKATFKKQSALLNGLKEAGFPIEQFYRKNLKNEKSSSASKHQEKSDTTIPKLAIKSPKESYQEEFMSKFKEFSESWRNQINSRQTYMSK